MFQYSNADRKDFLKPEDLAALGSEALAYMRQMTAEEIAEVFPGTPELEPGHLYWALFAADGSPLVLADSQSDVSSSAFYNNLEAVLPN